MSNAILLKDGRKLRDVCKEYNLNIQNIHCYKSSHPELEYEEIINIYLNKEKSFAQKCKEAGIDSIRAYKMRDMHKDWTDEQVISHCKQLDSNVSVRKACEIRGISYNDSVLAFTKQFNDKSNLEIVDMWINRKYTRKKKTYTLHDILQRNCISESTYYKVKSKFPDYSIDDIVKYIIDNRSKKEETFKEKCDKLGLNYNNAKGYKLRHINEVSSDDELLEMYIKHLTDSSISHLGETNKAYNGMMMTIIEWYSSDNITVQFEDGYIAKNRRYFEFRNGYIRNPNVITQQKNSERIGKEFNTNIGKVKVIDYKSSTDYDLLTESGEIIHGKRYDYLEKNLIVQLPKSNDRQRMCDEARISINTVYSYRREHNVSFDEAFEMCKKIKEGKIQIQKGALKELADKYNISIHIVHNLHSQYKDKMSFEEFEAMIKDKANVEPELTIKDRCKQDNIRYDTFMRVKHKYKKDASYEEIVKYIKRKEQEQECKRKADSLGIDNRTIRRLARIEGLDYVNDFDALVDMAKNNKIKRTLGIKNKENLRNLCEKSKIDYNTAKTFSYHHPELSDEQVIMYYRPDCYINIFGELVIPEK